MRRRPHRDARVQNRSAQRGYPDLDQWRAHTPPQGHGLGVRFRIYIRFLAIAGHLFAGDRTRPILAAHDILIDLLHRHGVDSVHRFDLLRVVRREPDEHDDAHHRHRELQRARLHEDVDEHRDDHAQHVAELGLGRLAKAFRVVDPQRVQTNRLVAGHLLGDQDNHLSAGGLAGRGAGAA